MQYLLRVSFLKYPTTQYKHIIDDSEKLATAF